MGATRIEAFVEEPTGRVVQHFSIRRMYNLGGATRDPSTAASHQQEAARSGIAITSAGPAPQIYPVANHAITIDDEVFVHGSQTSGEVEIALVETDRLYVGVASDHTDRALERISIPWSKQICPNILAPVLWRWEDMVGLWDRCVLRAHIDGRLYQEVEAGAFLSPPDMLRILRERTDNVPGRGLVVLGGTAPTLGGRLEFGTQWEISITAPDGRAIRHTYRVANLLGELHEGFRVPLETPKSATGAE